MTLRSTYTQSEHYAISSKVLQNVSSHTHENFKEMHSTGKDTDNWNSTTHREIQRSAANSSLNCKQHSVCVNGSICELAHVKYANIFNINPTTPCYPHNISLKFHIFSTSLNCCNVPRITTRYTVPYLLRSPQPTNSTLNSAHTDDCGWIAWTRGIAMVCIAYRNWCCFSSATCGIIQAFPWSGVAKFNAKSYCFYCIFPLSSVNFMASYIAKVYNPTLHALPPFHNCKIV